MKWDFLTFTSDISSVLTPNENIGHKYYTKGFLFLLFFTYLLVANSRSDGAQDAIKSCQKSRKPKNSWFYSANRMIKTSVGVSNAC